ncbi:MAG: hypothetical protein K6A41_04430 [Bacteroidales bacterium]|nr:hypothetical protein [Bacteroidales bacterium]
MKLKKCIVSLFLLAFTGSVFACSFGYINPKYHYLFFTGYDRYEGTYSTCSWKTAQDKLFKDENIEFWYNYVDKKVSKNAVEKAIYEQQFYAKTSFFQYLSEKKDSVALKYWGWVLTGDPKYTNWMMSSWYYPEEVNAHLDKADLKLLEQCSNREIQNRYVLQCMRRSFYLEDYKQCADIWKKYGKNIPESALRTQCLNYYGGALKRMNRDVDAAIVYAGIGYFDMYLHYNVDVLREMYRQTPNSKDLEFVVQQFVNQYQDNRKSGQSQAFSALAEEVVRDGKSSNPALWKSAEAALAYLDNDVARATQLIHQGDSLDGSHAAKENVKMLRLIIHAAGNLTGDAYDEALHPDLQWLTESINRDLRSKHTSYDDYESDEMYIYNWPTPSLHRAKVFRRAILLGVVPHFQKSGEIYKAIAYLNLYNETLCDSKSLRTKVRKGKITTPYPNHWTYNEDYWTRLFIFMDNAEIKDIQQYLNFLKKQNQTESDKFLLAHSYRDPNYFNELIATKFMRNEQYDSAIVYLSKVSDKFLKTQNIYPYLSNEDYYNPFREEWITKKELNGKFGLSFDPVQEYRQNPGKLNFCKIMSRLKREIAAEKDPNTRAQLRYAYIIGLYNSSVGRSWALTSYHNGQENIYGDEETDFNSKYYDPAHSRKLTESISKQLLRNLSVAEKEAQDKMLLNKCYCLRYRLVEDGEALYWDSASCEEIDWDHYEQWFDKKKQYFKDELQRVTNDIRKQNPKHNREELRKTFCDKQQNWKRDS